MSPLGGKGEGEHLGGLFKMVQAMCLQSGDFSVSSPGPKLLDSRVRTRTTCCWFGVCVQCVCTLFLGLRH